MDKRNATLPIMSHIIPLSYGHRKRTISPLPETGQTGVVVKDENSSKRSCLLEATISETQMIEMIKLETLRDMNWRLLNDGVIERVLVNQPSLALHSHRLSNMRNISLLPGGSKIRLVANEIDQITGHTRSIAWIARFNCRKEAKAWLNIINMVTKCRSRRVSSVPANSSIPVGKPDSDTQVITSSAIEHLACGDGLQEKAEISGEKSSHLKDVESSDSFIEITLEKPLPRPPKPRRTYLSIPTVDSPEMSSPVRHRLPVSNQFISPISPSSQTLLSLTPTSQASLGSTARRHVILRGTMEKHQPRHLRGLHFRAWRPVTWILYSDGKLEEYAKTNSCHDLLNVLDVAEFEVRVPMTSADVRRGGPNFTVPADCHIHLTRLTTGKRLRYNAPNKLMQIQWLGTLTSQRLPPRRKAPDTTASDTDSVAALPDKCRIPRKLSVLQEKCLVDFFGLIIPLWINVVWEYSDGCAVKRRYCEPVRHLVKPVTILDDLTPQKDHLITIPDCRKAASRKHISMYPGRDIRQSPHKSKRRFTISYQNSSGIDDICVRAESSQLRDEWYSILRHLRSTSLTTHFPVSAAPIVSPDPAWLLRQTRSALEVSISSPVDPDTAPGSYSMSAADALLDEMDSHHPLLCQSDNMDDCRLFHFSPVVERCGDILATSCPIEVLRKRKSVLDSGEGYFKVLPRLAEDLCS